jgi:hypothetical protein
MTCYWYASVTMHQQYLRFQPEEAQSLVPLTKQIPERYSTVLDIDDEDDVMLKADEIEEFLEHEAETPRHRSPVLEKTEVALVESIIKAHLQSVTGGPDIYARFGFGDFFNMKTEPPATMIYLPPKTQRHMHAARVCLEAVCDHFDDETLGEIKEYAWECFA